MSDDSPFFSVAYCLDLNIKPLPDDFTLPSDAEFDSQIPESFKLASPDFNQTNDIANSLKSLGDTGNALAHYLKTQAERLNQILTYVLAMQDDPQFRTSSTQFGGSRLQFEWPILLSTGQLLEIKIFLPEEACAIYCYGQVIENDHQSGHITCEYVQIREEDQEALVRASLHAQSKLLQARAKARQENHD